MTHLDPTPFITAFNAWDRNDLDLPPAAVSETSVQCLPETPCELIAMLPETHRSFMQDTCGPEYQTLTFARPETTTGFDPTADVLPDAGETSAGREAQAQATRYFGDRPRSHRERQGLRPADHASHRARRAMLTGLQFSARLRLAERMTNQPVLVY